MDLHSQQKGNSKITAADIVKRISEHSGVSLPDRAVDGFKFGDESMIVRGVAVTSMATVEVIRHAAKSGLNLVLSFEPTFFSRSDGQPAAAGAGGGVGPGGLGGPPAAGPGGPAQAQGQGQQRPPAQGGPGGPGRGLAQDDPVLVAKRELLKSSGIVVYRLHDQWSGRKENEHAIALAKAMGWTRSAAGHDPATEYEIAGTSLSALVPQVRTKLKSSGGMRVIGDPKTLVKRVTVLPGVQELAKLLARLPSTDLILAGEVRDWEGPEYVGDASTAGLKKGLITVGRVVSEDPGMGACASWLKTFINEVPVEWIAAGEPYWRPA